MPPSDEVLFDRDSTARTISLAMGMYGMFDRDGIFVVRLNPQLFHNAYRHLANPDLLIELVDQEGRLVYASSEFDSLAEELPKEWMTIRNTLDSTGFHTTVRLNKTAVFDKVNQVNNLNISVIIGVLLVSLLLAIILSLTLVRPVRKLHGLMKKVEKGDLNVHFPVRSKDEISRLGLGFNKMITSLSSLIQEVYVIRLDKMQSELKQKEAMIMAMQSQINPHFLYNTLEAINCHAIVNNVPSVSRMSQALADFFRYSIEKQEVIVPLFKEVRHVETYLEIQYQRRPDIDVHIQIPVLLKPCPIIKLTLQPLIENAFIHGFRGDRDYRLTVRAEASEQVCLIHVEDNGEGMELAALEHLNEQFVQDSGMAALDDGSMSTGIGLINVHQRLQMQFGPSSGLRLQPSASGGLRVTATVPWKSDKRHASDDTRL